MKKTIIFVWSQRFNISEEHLQKYNYLKETNFFFGLGDLIRASIKLFSLSQKMGFDFILDIQLHPLSTFLKKINHKYSENVLINKDNIDYVCYGAVEDYVNSKKPGSISYMFTNDFYKGEITRDIKGFIKNIFRPTIPFQKYIEDKISTIPFQSYNILHYRLNDDEFLNKKTEVNHVAMLEHVNMNKESADILITDTQGFKSLVSDKKIVFTFDTKICHLGLSTDNQAIKDTLFEFFLITKSSKIKTYCKIHQMSGFVKWVSQIYDIPVLLI